MPFPTRLKIVVRWLRVGLGNQRLVRAADRHARQRHL